MKLLRGQWFCTLAIHLLSHLARAAERQECCWVITSQRAALLHYVLQLQSTETFVIQSGKLRTGHAERKMVVCIWSCVCESNRVCMRWSLCASEGKTVCVCILRVGIISISTQPIQEMNRNLIHQLLRLPIIFNEYCFSNQGLDLLTPVERSKHDAYKNSLTCSAASAQGNQHDFFMLDTKESGNGAGLEQLCLPDMAFI